MIVNYERLIDIIVKAMRDQAREAKTDKAEVDISGGVDSAVVVALACKAFGPENVIGVYSDIASSPESFRLANLVAEKFGFRLVCLDLNEVYDLIVSEVLREFARLGISPLLGSYVTGGLRSCLRAPVGRFVNKVFGGGIREGTGNRDEDELIRFFQKGGDGEVDSNWIEGLFKSEVWELAEYLDVPQEVINAKPTPDLWGIGALHNDEDELKYLTGVQLTYTCPNSSMGTIEWVSRENEKNGIINGIGESIPTSLLVKEPYNYTEIQCQVIEAIRKLEKQTRHKADTPPFLSREYLKSYGTIK